MGAWFSFISVVVLILVAWVGVKGMGLYTLFGIIVPYLAVSVFLQQAGNRSLTHG